MSIALVQKNNTTNGSGTQTSVTCVFTGAQTAGDLIIVAVTGNTGTTHVTSPITDSKGNTYVQANANLTFNGFWCEVWYAKNIAAATAGANTVTVALSAATTSTDVRIYEFSGCDTVSPLDKVHAATGSSTAPSSGATAATTAAVELVFGACGTAEGVTAQGGGFTLLQITSPNADGDEFLVTASTGAQTATFTISPSGFWIAQVATFAGAAVATVMPPLPIMVSQAVQRAATR